MCLSLYLMVDGSQCLKIHRAASLQHPAKHTRTDTLLHHAMAPACPLTAELQQIKLIYLTRAFCHNQDDGGPPTN